MKLPWCDNMIKNLENCVQLTEEKLIDHIQSYKKPVRQKNMPIGLKFSHQ